jgi:hypothetical protein
MAFTRADVFASARWQARQHVAECDALTAAQWEACLARAWRRLWTCHAAAFHADGELVGRLPDLPAAAVPDPALPIVPEWLDVLGAGVAADALGNIAVDDPDRLALVAGVIQVLEARFIRGIGG